MDNKQMDKKSITKCKYICSQMYIIPRSSLSFTYIYSHESIKVKFVVHNINVFTFLGNL